MTGTPAPVTGWSAADLMRIEFPPPRWAVEDFIPEGLTLIVGKPKVGKSWLVLGLSLAVAAGGRALGSIPVVAGDVLYLALEDTGRRLQERLGAILGRSTAPDRMRLETSWPRANEGGTQRLEAWLTAHPTARLVVVDTLVKYRPRAKGSDSGYDADYEAIVPLQDLANRHRVSVIVVHHQRKLTSEDWVDSISGTLGLAGAADGMVGLFRERGAAEATLKLTGRDVEDTEKALRWSGATSSWQLTAPHETSRGPVQATILQLLREHGPMTPGRIAELLERNPSTTRTLLAKMVDHEQVVVLDGRRYGARHEGPSTSSTPSISSLSLSLSLSPPPPIPQGGDGVDRVDAPPLPNTDGASEASTPPPPTVAIPPSTPPLSVHPSASTPRPIPRPIPRCPKCRATVTATRPDDAWCQQCRKYVRPVWPEEVS